MQLKAMIAKVNNTFDKRRMYFLPTDMEQEKELKEKHIAVNSMNKIPAPKGESFQYKRPKDFHVSPFSSRKGMYSLAARDPALPTTEQSVEPKSREESIIDIKANLLSSKGHVKLVTHLRSSGTPLDPSYISWLEFVVFLSCWWWVGLITCETPPAHMINRSTGSRNDCLNRPKNPFSSRQACTLPRPEHLVSPRT